MPHASGIHGSTIVELAAAYPFGETTAPTDEEARP
jgi:hypothetical protein